MKKIAAVVCVLLCAVTLVAAEGTLGGSVSVAAQYPVAGKLSAGVDYTMPCLNGDGSNPLTSGNNLVLSAYADVTPVTAGADFSATLTPIAFIILKGGAYVGSGWKFMGNDGLASAAVDAAPLYYKGYANATFQFDLAAVMPGDWNHVVTQWLYEVNYNNALGNPAKTPFIWQAGQKVAAPAYYAKGIIAYQMPLVLQTVGTQLEWEGAYGTDIIDSFSISAVSILKFGAADEVACQAKFKGGFDSFGVQYTHKF